MDENKKKKLEEINYKIHPCCGACKHGDFMVAMPWGVCQKFTYDHLKHTGDDRNLSVHRSGVCDSFEENEAEKGYLGAFAEFCE